MSTNKGPKPCPNEGENGDKRCTFKNCGNIHTNTSSKAYIPLGGGAKIPVCQPAKVLSTKRCNTCEQQVFGKFQEHNQVCPGKSKKTEPVVCNKCNQELKESWGEHKKICPNSSKLNPSAKVFIPSTTVNTDEGDGEEKDELNNAFIADSDDEEEEEEEDNDDLSLIEEKLYGEDDDNDDFCEEVVSRLDNENPVGHWFPYSRECKVCNGFCYGKFEYSLCETCFSQ